MHVAIHHLATGCICYTYGIYTACNIHAERWAVSPVISLPSRCGVDMRAPAVRHVIIRHMWCDIHACGARQTGDMVQMLLCYTSDTNMACHIHAKRWAVSPALARSLLYDVDLRTYTRWPWCTTSSLISTASMAYTLVLYVASCMISFFQRYAVMLQVRH